MVYVIYYQFIKYCNTKIVHKELLNSSCCNFDLGLYTVHTILNKWIQIQVMTKSRAIKKNRLHQLSGQHLQYHGSAGAGGPRGTTAEAGATTTLCWGMVVRGGGGRATPGRPALGWPPIWRHVCGGNNKNPLQSGL
jgi:hypothetical protein